MLLSNVHIVYDLIHLHYQSAGTYVDKLSAIHGYHLAAVCVCVCLLMRSHTKLQWKCMYTYTYGVHILTN